MKRILLIIVLSLIIPGIFAIEKTKKRIAVKKVSSSTLSQFQQEFSTAKNVSWITNEKYVKASFFSTGKRMVALYDLDGNFIGSIEYLSYDQLPYKAKTEIESKYKDYTFVSARRIASRPTDNSSFNDVGSYWIDLTNESGRIYINVSPKAGISLYKSTSFETFAKN
jgi:hypothetical protein